MPPKAQGTDITKEEINKLLNNEQYRQKFEELRIKKKKFYHLLYNYIERVLKAIQGKRKTKQIYDSARVTAKELIKQKIYMPDGSNITPTRFVNEIKYYVDNADEIQALERKIFSLEIQPGSEKNLGSMVQNEKEMIWTIFNRLASTNKTDRMGNKKDYNACTDMVSLFDVKRKGLKIRDSIVRYDKSKIDQSDIILSDKTEDVFYCNRFASQTLVIDSEPDTLQIHPKLLWALENGKKVMFLLASSITNEQMNQLFRRKGSHTTMFLIFPNYEKKGQSFYLNPNKPYLTTSFGLGPSIASEYTKKSEDMKRKRRPRERKGNRKGEQYTNHAEMASPDKYAIPKPFFTDKVKALINRSKGENSKPYRIFDIGQFKKGHLSRIQYLCKRGGMKQTESTLPENEAVPTVETELYLDEMYEDEEKVLSGKYSLKSINVVMNQDYYYSMFNAFGGACKWLGNEDSGVYNCASIIEWIFQERITCSNFGVSDPAACRQRNRKDLEPIYSAEKIDALINSFLFDDINRFIKKTLVRGENQYMYDLDEMTVEDVEKHFMNIKTRVGKKRRFRAVVLKDDFAKLKF